MPYTVDVEITLKDSAKQSHRFSLKANQYTPDDMPGSDTRLVKEINDSLIVKKKGEGTVALQTAIREHERKLAHTHARSS